MKHIQASIADEQFEPPPPPVPSQPIHFSIHCCGFRFISTPISGGILGKGGEKGETQLSDSLEFACSLALSSRLGSGRRCETEERRKKRGKRTIRRQAAAPFQGISRYTRQFSQSFLHFRARKSEFMYFFRDSGRRNY